MVFFPSFVGSPLYLTAFAALSIVLFRRGFYLDALLLLSLSLVVSFVLDVTLTRHSYTEESAAYIGAVAIEDGSVKKRGMYGFPAALAFSYDGSEIYSSSKGEVYIYSSKENVRAGDKLIARGYFSGPSFFISDSIRVVEKAFMRDVRKKAEGFIRKRLAMLDEGSANLSLMLLLAISDDGDSDLSKLSREKGVTHVFALSGMHLGMIASLLLPFLSPFIGERRARKVILLPLLFFTFLSGFRASLLRALILRSLFTIFPESDEGEIFALTFIIHASLFPESLIRAGAVFSYISVAGMFMLSRKMEERSERLTGFTFSHTLTSISCLIFTIPYSYYLFSSYSLSGLIFAPLVNFLVTIYMALSLLFLFFPLFPFLLDFVYSGIEKVLSLNFLSHSFDDLKYYFILLFAFLFLYAATSLKSRHILFILKQCGILITRVKKSLLSS